MCRRCLAGDADKRRRKANFLFVGAGHVQPLQTFVISILSYLFQSVTICGLSFGFCRPFDGEGAEGLGRSSWVHLIIHPVCLWILFSIFLHKRKRARGGVTPGSFLLRHPTGGGPIGQRNS